MPSYITPFICWHFDCIARFVLHCWCRWRLDNMFFVFKHFCLTMALKWLLLFNLKCKCHPADLITLVGLRPRTSASESNTHPEGQNVCSLDNQKLLTGAYKIILSVFCYTPIPPDTHTHPLSLDNCPVHYCTYSPSTPTPPDTHTPSQPGQLSSPLLHVQPFHSNTSWHTHTLSAWTIVQSITARTALPLHNDNRPVAVVFADTHTPSQPGQLSSPLLHVQPFLSTMTTVLLLLFLLHST